MYQDETGVRNPPRRKGANNLRKEAEVSLSGVS